MTLFLATLFVEDVEATSRWYQQLFGVQSAHGGPEFEMLAMGEQIVLHLHKAGADEHGEHGVGAPGLLLGFPVESVDAVHALHAKAIELGVDVELAPTYNEKAHHTELVVRDPNGYTIAVSSPFQP